jgi:hypothetical protein
MNIQCFTKPKTQRITKVAVYCYNTEIQNAEMNYRQGYDRPHNGSTHKFGGRNSWNMST